LFRRLFLEQLVAAHQRGELHFFGQTAELADASTFRTWLEPIKKLNWYVDARRPFAGPAAVLEYLSRYTHRVAISNSRLLNFDEHGVTFKYKDYRTKGRYRNKVMTLSTDEFIRRFLMHVLPSGFHRIRHYGLFTNAQRADNLSKARVLLDMDEPADVDDDTDEDTATSTFICRSCSAPMIVIHVFPPDHAPRAPPQSRATS
jgi:hypothetical protein